MAKSAAEAVVEEPVVEPADHTEKDVRQHSRPKRQPPYAVILHNDDLNTIDHVINVLRKVFNYDRTKSVKLTLEAHKTGRSAVWSGTMELAELKAEQIRSCGPDPEMKAQGALTLRVTIEPLPQ